jgi:hypothetical protein
MHGSLLPIPVGDDIGAFDMGMFYPPAGDEANSRT